MTEQIKAASAVIGMIDMHRGLGDCIKKLTKISPFEELSKDHLDEIRDVIQDGIAKIFSPKSEKEEMEIVLQILKEILTDKSE